MRSLVSHTHATLSLSHTNSHVLSFVFVISETCETQIDDASCFPTTTVVDIYYTGNNTTTAELQQRLIDALNATDLEALFAGIGVLEVGPVVVTPADDDDDGGGGTIVQQQSAQGLAVGAIAAIAFAAIVMLLLLMYVGRARRRNDTDDEDLKHVYLDDDHILDDGTYAISDGRKSLIVGDDDSSSRRGSLDILQDLTDFEQYCSRDVHRCASATCEVCRQKRLHPIFISAGLAPPPSPPRVPQNAKRGYSARDTVDF